MSYRIEPDLLLVDSFGRPLAVVETKLGYSPEDEWAMKLAEEYANTIGAPYAMAISPNWLEFVHLPEASPSLRQRWTVSSMPYLGTLFEELGFDPEKVSGQGFEGLVALWFDDLSATLRAGNPLPSGLQFFQESGFAAMLAQANVKRYVRFETVR